MVMAHLHCTAHPVKARPKVGNGGWCIGAGLWHGRVEIDLAAHHGCMCGYNTMVSMMWQALLRVCKGVPALRRCFRWKCLTGVGGKAAVVHGV